jgi:hypothetical protein
MGESELSFSQAVTVLHRRGYLVRFADGHYEITRAGDSTVQVVDRAGLILKAQALLQFDRAPVGDEQVSGEQL